MFSTVILLINIINVKICQARCFLHTKITKLILIKLYSNITYINQDYNSLKIFYK